MPIAGLALGYKGLKIAITKVEGPSSYTAGGFNVVINDLKKVHEAIVVASNGYLAEVASITGNTVKVVVRYFDYDATADGAAIEVPNGTDLSGVTFTVIAIGE